MTSSVLATYTAIWFALVLAIPSIQAAVNVQSPLFYVALFVAAIPILLKAALMPLSELRADALIFVAAPLALILVLLGSSITWTIGDSSRYSLDLLLLAALVAMAVLTPLMIAASDFKTVMRRFSVALVCYGLLLSGFVAASYYLTQGLASSGKLFSEEVHRAYLTVSYFMGISLIAASAHLFYPGNARLVWLPLWLILSLALALSIGRGPLMFAVFFSLLLLRAGRKQAAAGSLRAAGTFFISAAIIGGNVVAILQFGVADERFARLFLDFGREWTEGGRGILWANAFQQISQAPIAGWGISASGILSAENIESYPHNIYLQIWLDGGLTSLALLATATGIPAIIAARALLIRESSKYHVMICALYLYCLLNYQKSESFYSARDLIMFGALVIVGWRSQGRRSAGNREAPALNSS